MRHTTRTMWIALVVMWCCGQIALAQESGSRWWPFGNKQETAPLTTPASPTLPPSAAATLPPSQAITPVGPHTTASPYLPQSQATLPGQPQATVQTDRPPVLESPFADLAWPTMPEVSFPKPRMPQIFPKRSELDETRNAWAGPGATPERPSPLQAVRDGTRRVGESTRAAWRKTVDTLTPGNETATTSPPQVASRDIKPPFWKRMFGPEEPQPPQGPRTITEWMAQDRLDP